MSFQLTGQQQAVVDNRGGQLLVSAAAGSGKTRVLVERLLARVTNEGRDVDEFLVITFTNAAAAELRGRIVEELGNRLAQTPGDGHLRRQTTLVYKAQISTIHALCVSLLREWGHVLDLDPDWRLCDEGEAAALRRRVLDTVLEARYAALVPGDDFARLVDAVTVGRDDDRLCDIVLDTFQKMQSHPAPDAWLARQRTQFALDGVTDPGETPWGALLLNVTALRADFFAKKFDSLAALCGQDGVLAKQYLPSAAATADSLRAFAQAARRGWAYAEEFVVEFPALGRVSGCENPELQARFKKLRDQYKRKIIALRSLFEQSAGDLLDDLRAVYPAVCGLFDLVTDFSAAYQAEKARRRVLDFGDLEHFSAALLVDDAGKPTALAAQMGARWQEIMVDEYQDTNEVQNVIFTALSQEERNLFLVGDVKQSIYRFRLADPGIFMEKYRTFPPYSEAGEGMPRKIILSQNFRSRAEVLAGTNDLFRNLMSVEAGEMDYGADEALYPGRDFAQVDDARVSLAVIDASGMTKGEGAADKNLIEARYVAQRIGALLAQEYLIEDGGGLRPALPEDIAILLRSPGPVTRHYARALAECGIPWQAEGSGAFFDTTEVAVALSLLQVVDNPRQDVPLIAVLRAPIFGFSADRLAGIRAAAPDVDFYTALEQDGGADCAAFLSELSELRFCAADKRSHELLWELYERTNFLGIFNAMDGGQERRDNLLALYEIARKFEAGGHRGLYGFLSHLDALRAAGQLPRAAQPGKRGVSIVSIHRSKGLEYPIVFVSGLGRRFNRSDSSQPMLFHSTLGVGPKRLDLKRMMEYPTLARLAIARKLDSELLAEELRLLYVAMTRAREKLILTCALGQGRAELESQSAHAACPVEPQAVAMAQSAAEWILMCALCRPEAGVLRDAAGMTAVPDCPALDTRWDISWVDGQAYETPLSAPRDGSAAQDDMRPLPDSAALAAKLAWVYPHMAAADTPSKLTATQLKGRELDREVAEQGPAAEATYLHGTEDRQNTSRALRTPVFFGDKAPREMTAAERGTAMHLAIQFMDFARTDTPEAVRAEVERLVAQQFLTAEQGGAVDAIRLLAFFQSETGRDLLAARDLHREFKFSVLETAGQYYSGLDGEMVLMQGVVDCWYDTPDGIVVVDFKTDRVTDETIADRAKEYAPQLMAYSRALSAITHRPTARRVLWFFSLNRAVEV